MIISDNDLLHTPLLDIPAKRFASLTARAFTVVFVKPVLTLSQRTPLFVERKTPFEVATKTFVSEKVRDRTFRLVKPVFISVQLVPLSVEIKTPWYEDPA